MKTKRLECLMVLVVFCWLVLSGSAAAQGGYKYKNGMKYPESARIHKGMQAGPQNTMKAIPVPDRKILKEGGGDAPVHLDSLVSYSTYEGNTVKKTYTYCGENLMTLLVRSLLGEDWVNFELVTYTYDSQGHVMTMTDQGWDGSAWVDFLIFTYTYDALGRQQTWLYQDVSGGFQELITSTYDSYGNLHSELGEIWTGSLYENLEYYEYSYYPNGDRESMIWQYWTGSAWENWMRESWTYYTPGKWETDLVEVWDGLAWINDSYYVNTFDLAGNLESYTGSYWNGVGDWIPMFSALYTYDSYGNRLSDVQRYWPSSDPYPEWIATDSTAITYDYSDKEITGYGYVQLDGEWVPGETYIYIPFINNGEQLLFAAEWPSHEVDVYYSSPVEYAVEAGPDATIYIGYPPLSTQLNASGAESYSWSPVTGLSNPNIPNPIASPSSTTTYTLTGTSPDGCVATDQVTVTVVDVRCGKKLDKVLVCLVPPGNPGNAHTVCVDKNSVQALLKNGSYLGPCLAGDSPNLYSSEIPGEFSLEVSPNPVSEGFLVTISTPLTEPFKIRLYDTQGRLVQVIYEGELDSGEHQITVRSIDSPVKGMFFLNVLSPSQSSTVKLIRQ